MAAPMSCFYFFLESCNLVKWPLKRSVECYSRLHLFTDIIGNDSEKADEKGQLNVLEKE